MSVTYYNEKCIYTPLTVVETEVFVVHPPLGGMNAPNKFHDSLFYLSFSCSNGNVGMCYLKGKSGGVTKNLKNHRLVTLNTVPSLTVI